MKNITVILSVLISIIGCTLKKNSLNRETNNIIFNNDSLIVNIKGKKKNSHYINYLLAIKLKERISNFEVIVPLNKDKRAQWSINFHSVNKDFISFKLVLENAPSSHIIDLSFPVVGNVIAAPVSTYFNYNYQGFAKCSKQLSRIINLDKTDIFSQNCFEFNTLDDSLSYFNIGFGLNAENSNKLKIENSITNDSIIVAFSGKVLSFIPEKDFAISWINKVSKDTLKTYFSFTKWNSWSIDSTTNFRKNLTKVNYKEIKFGYNYFLDE